jgi:carbohydrate-selective porin OprB
MAISQLHKFKQSKEILSLFLIVFCILLLSVPVVSQTTGTAPASTDFFTQKYLLGDWGGERTKLAEEKGVTFDFHYMGDFLYAANARIQDGGAGWNRVRGTMDIDFGKLVGPSMKNWSFHVTGLWQGGPNLGANYLGSISNPSTLVSARTEMLDSYWLQYAMLDQKVTLKFGQLASMDYFGLPPWIWHFMMEPLSYGFQNRFNDYASFDPASGPGAMLQVTPYPWMYYSIAYTSGNRNPYVQDPNGFHYVKFNSGVLSDNVGFKINQPGTGKATKDKYYTGQYEMGSTYNGGKFTNPLNPVPLALSPDTGNYVFYFWGDQAIYRPKAGSTTGMDVVGGMSYSPNATYNFVDKNVLVGLIYNGPIPSRPNDSINFGLSYTHVSDSYASAYAFANPTAAPYSSEKAYEFNYSFQVTPYWYVQPTVEIFNDVGGIAKAGTAEAIGFRTKVTF